MKKIEFKYSEITLDVLENLAFILYSCNYFASILIAQEYVDSIITKSENSISKNQYKKSPPKLSNLGTSYSTVISNKRTSWYFFFLQEGDKVLITYVSNNHQEIAQYLNLPYGR